MSRAMRKPVIGVSDMAKLIGIIIISSFNVEIIVTNYLKWQSIRVTYKTNNSSYFV